MWKFDTFCIAVLLTATLAAYVNGQAAPTTAPADSKADADARPTLWIIGDSTVRNNTKGQRGWGDPIKELFDESRINVVNRAIGGRSSRTFRTDGRWEQILSEGKPGDFVLMQFGHNDPAPLSGDNRERGTIRGVGDESQEVTLTLKEGKKEVVRSFGWYMRAYINEAKEKGMTPIVCSYVPRAPRGTPEKPAVSPTPTAEPTSYALWAKQSAAAAGATFIDLHNLIVTKYSQHTPTEIKERFFSEADYTHTNDAGAALNAACVVEGIRAGDLPLKDYLKRP
ncbi:MAG TPA: rhamnogalacturonan acetylesterase [Tepidisphaeraceae bacterium]|jgi:lysophospholipase L1-like esterase|nr:rhamnogalacturonan acetylesterase [Tepidisphaeraceae bacterium]